MWRNILLLFPISLVAAQTNAPDQWLAGDVVFPRFSAHAFDTDRFSSLRAEVVSDQFQVVWSPARDETNSVVRIVFSADAPGHWPARDWRALPMQRYGAAWKTTVPLDSVDVPFVYFVESRNGEATNISAMRVASPRALGLHQPTKAFWTFLDGFEQGTDSWRVIGSDDALRVSSLAKSGETSLTVRVAGGRASITVATTRLRGWFAEEHRARGIGFWARTTSGAGEVRGSLVAEAFTTNQVLVTQTNAAKLTANWRRVEIPFREFPGFALADLDLVAFEFSGSPDTEFLLDDFSLLGRWPFE